MKSHTYSLSALLALSSSAALADNNVNNNQTDATLSTVTVSADFRQKNDQQLANSTSITNQQQLENKGINHADELLLQTPNLMFSGETSRARHLLIRGMGERSSYTGAPNHSVGFAIDDIDFSGVGGVASLFDTKQVEVLRGPQSARFGASALAGLVNVQTNDPTAERESMIEATAGGDGLYEFGLMTSGAFSGQANSPQYRLAVFKHRSNGFRHNSYLNRDATNGKDELNIRGKLRFFPNSVTQVDLTLLHADYDNSYDAFSMNNNFTTESDQPGQDKQRSTAGAIKVRYQGNPYFTLQSNTSLAQTDMRYSYDQDWLNDPANRHFYDNQKDRQTMSQEVRLISTPASRLFGNTDWLVGAYASRLNEYNSTDDTYTYKYYKGSKSNYQLTKAAIFGQLDIPLTSSTTLTTALRVEHHMADFSGNVHGRFDNAETLWGGSLALTEKLNEQHTAYISATKGYKAGGINAGVSDPSMLRFGSETAMNYELGLKSIWPNIGLDSKINLFYIDRNNPQLNSNVKTTDIGYVFFTENLDTARHYGAEAELNWKASNRLTLNAGLGLLHTEMSGTPNAAKYNNVANGRDLAHAPNYQLNLGATYQHPSGFFAHANWQATDEFYFSNSHSLKSEPYQITNARLGYRQDSWEVYVWGKNIADNKYATRGFFFDNGAGEQAYYRFGDRQQFGVTTRFYF